MAFKVLADALLYVANLAFFAHVNYRNRHASLSGAASTTAAVSVGGNIVGQAVVDDMSEVIYIDATGSHIGSYEQLYVVFAEFFHHEVALSLREVAV